MHIWFNMVQPDIKITTFGERLKQLRAQKGMSQTELGDQVDIHYTQIGRYERGLSKPSAEALSLLAECLGVSTDYLYEGEEEDAAIANLDDKELLQMFSEVEKFAPEEKKEIKSVIDAFIKRKKLNELVTSKTA